MKTRFVVHSAAHWAAFAAARYFLKPLEPEFDPKADENDPVENLLYEIASDQIPQDFEFTHKDRDSKGSGWLGEEGIEIEVFDDAKDGLELGQIVDLEITVVGRVNFR